jgi:hypothetical protein
MNKRQSGGGAPDARSIVEKRRSKQGATAASPVY